MNSSHYYNNDVAEEVWCYTALSESGANQMFLTMKKVLGWEVLEKPILRDDGLYIIMFRNPLLS